MDVKVLGLFNLGGCRTYNPVHDRHIGQSPTDRRAPCRLSHCKGIRNYLNKALKANRGTYKHALQRKCR